MSTSKASFMVAHFSSWSRASSASAGGVGLGDAALRLTDSPVQRLSLARATLGLLADVDEPIDERLLAAILSWIVK